MAASLLEEKDEVFDLTSEGSHFNDPSFLRDCCMATETHEYETIKKVIKEKDKINAPTQRWAHRTRDGADRLRWAPTGFLQYDS